MPCEPDAAAVVVAQSKSPDALMLAVGEADGVAEALADLDKELYVICEQDMYGCDPAYPAPNAAKVREYLASLGLGLA